jgi:hypothetical protein
MGSFIQTVGLKVKDNHLEALAAVKRYKTFMEKRGAKVSAYLAIEAGQTSGHAVVATVFPNASAWAKLVDDKSEELNIMRYAGITSDTVTGTALAQEIDL